MSRRKGSTRYFFRLGPGFGMSRRSEDIGNPFATGLLVGAMRSFSRKPLAFLIMLPVFLPIILIALALELLTPFIKLGAQRLGVAIGDGIGSLFQRSSPAAPKEAKASQLPSSDPLRATPKIPRYRPAGGYGRTRPIPTEVIIPESVSTPPSTMPEQPPNKLLGNVTWLEAQESSYGRYPVVRAISRPPTEIVIDCDCGEPHKPYLYTITLRCSEDGTVQGSFVASSGSNISTGSATGRCYQSPTGYVITGLWVEDGSKSEFFAELTAVAQFPDETAA